MTTKNEEAKQWMAERIKARQQKKKGITFSVTQYQDMKADGMSDAKIVAKYNSNVAILNAWKKEHNLIGKHNLKTIQKEQGEAVEVKVMNDKADIQNATEKPVEVLEYEKLIEHLKQVNERQLADNQKLAEENEKLHKKLQEPADGTVEGLEVEIAELRKRKATLASELQTSRDGSMLQENLVTGLSEKLTYADKRINGLEEQVEKLICELDIRNSEYALLENQLNNATKRIEDLKRFERDYQALEVMHSNMRARTHSMEDEVEETRAAMKILDSLYRGQSALYLKSRDRLDELEVEV